jgi:hypothetical protein
MFGINVFSNGGLTVVATVTGAVVETKSAAAVRTRRGV